LENPPDWRVFLWLLSSARVIAVQLLICFAQSSALRADYVEPEDLGGPSDLGRNKRRFVAVVLCNIARGL
jgi:hypothetical protein